jgi:hypothetical protein
LHDGKVRSVEANCSGKCSTSFCGTNFPSGRSKSLAVPLYPAMALTDHPRIHKVTDEVSWRSRGQYLHGPKDLRTESRPIEAPGLGEVQIAIRATTLCGSDLHYYAHGRNGSLIVREPLCLGHDAKSVTCASVGATTSVQSFVFVGVPLPGHTIKARCRRE